MKFKTRNCSHTLYVAFFVATALLFSSVMASGQTSVSVAPLKMNVLYIGVDNPVSVAASTASDDRVTVSIVGGGGTISRLKAGVYNVRVTTATDDCTVNVYVDGNLHGSSKFRVRLLPEPLGTIGGFRSGDYIGADVLRSQLGLGIYVQNSPFDTKYEVVGFSVKLMDEKGSMKTADCEGNLFSATAKEYLNEYAKPGDVVTIEKILVKSEDGKKIKLPPLLYNIK